MSRARDLGNNFDGSKSKVIDAAGDIIYGTGSDSASRLAIGTAGQVLQVNSGATAPQWGTISAGGMTEIVNGSLSGPSVVIGSIPNTYKSLKLIIRNFRPTNDGNTLLLRFNNDSTSNRYAVMASSSQWVSFDRTSIPVSNAQDSGGTSSMISIIDIEDYANTNTWKTLKYYSFGNKFDVPSDIQFNFAYGAYSQTNQITSIGLTTESATNFQSGTYILYGVS